MLQFWPGMWPNRAPVSEDMTGTTRQLASGQESWSAALVVGNEVAAGGTLAASGAAVTRAPGLGGLGGAIAEGVGGRRAGPSAEHDSLLTAVWIEYAVTAPGRRPRVIRRAAFDLVGQAAREVARVLHPHFVREEEIALPPVFDSVHKMHATVMLADIARNYSRYYDAGREQLSARLRGMIEARPDWVVSRQRA